MSCIFDALQRCERERSGVDRHSLATATQLLRISEERLQGHRPEFTDAVERGETDTHKLEEIGKESEHRKSATFTGTIRDSEVPPVGAPECTQKSKPWKLASAPGTCLVSITDPDSLAAEKFRYLAVRLQKTRNVRPLKTVLVTSTIPGEGKSTLAANLACTLAANAPGKTLLLDGDLRRSSVARLFGLKGISGLTECLRSVQSLEASLVQVAQQNLWVLVGGRACTSPLELLQAGGLPALMERLNGRFDWIIIDSAPVLPMADTSIWMGLVDGIVLVTRPGTTRLKQLKKGLEAIAADKLIGAVSNCSRAAARQDEYYYSYSRQTVK